MMTPIEEAAPRLRRTKRSTRESMRFRIGDCDLSCDVHGDGPAVLFVHGFPLAGEMWMETARQLSDRWRCIVPDLRGHGQSQASPQVTMARLADDLADLLDKLREWRPVVVVGLSMGGYIAFEFFRRHRARVRALVLCDTRASADTPEGAAGREALAQTVLREGSGAAADAMIDKVFAPRFDPAMREHWRSVMSGNPPMGVAAAARAMAGRADSRPTLAQIDCPTLLVVGEEDSLTPTAVMEEMHRAISGSRLEIIPGAGHVPPVEQPEKFTEVLRAFLSGLGSSGVPGE